MQAPHMFQGCVFPFKLFDSIFSQGGFKKEVTLSQEHFKMSFRSLLWDAAADASVPRQLRSFRHQKIAGDPEWPLCSDLNFKPFQ